MNQNFGFKLHVMNNTSDLNGLCYFPNNHNTRILKVRSLYDYTGMCISFFVFIFAKMYGFFSNIMSGIFSGIKKTP